MGVSRVIQKPWLCGPATLEMLFSWYDVRVDQEIISQATELPPCDLFRFGYSLYVLNHAIQHLDNGFQLLVKYDTSIEELAGFTRIMPVGVEWRCMFREPDGQIWGEGHYCLIETVDQQQGVIHLIDPYYSENLSHTNGVVSIADFDANWWDENTMPDENGADVKVWTRGAVFILAPCGQLSRFKALGFAPMSPQLAFEHQTAPREITVPTPTFFQNPCE